MSIGSLQRWPAVGVMSFTFEDSFFRIHMPGLEVWLHLSWPPLLLVRTLTVKLFLFSVPNWCLLFPSSFRFALASPLCSLRPVCIPPIFFLLAANHEPTLPTHRLNGVVDYLLNVCVLYKIIYQWYFNKKKIVCGKPCSLCFICCKRKRTSGLHWGETPNKRGEF